MALDIRVTDPNDSSNPFDFTLFPKESGGKEIEVISRPWENDHRIPWQVDLHGWDEGLGPDRFRGRKTYAKANADFTYSGLVVPPPKVNLLEPSNIIMREETLGKAISGSTVTLNVISTVQDDDQMFVMILTDTQVSHAQASWTQVGSNLDFGSATRISLWRKKAATEPASYQWTFGSSTTGTISTVSLVGVDTSSPIDDTDEATNSTETSVSIPQSTSTGDFTKRLVYLGLDGVSRATVPNNLTGIRGSFTGEASSLTGVVRHIMVGNFGTAATTSAGDAVGLLTSRANGIFQVLLTPASSFTVGFTRDKAADYQNYKWFHQGNLVTSIRNLHHPISQIQKDFGAAVKDVEIFNDEVVVAMGAATKLWTRTTPGTTDVGTWAQASDNTFAIHFGTTKNQLWRDEDAQKISNAITTPETLTNWVPASPNQYDVGDSSYSITKLVDYAGAIWVGKINGMYAPNQLAEYQNQTPQMAFASNEFNCKGTFLAKGFLWVPALPLGLLRVGLGESLAMGPELSER